MPAQKFSDKYSLKTLNMEPTGILPPNQSQQHLVEEQGDSVPALNRIEDDKVNPERISWFHWVTVIVLCYVNLINYMDRYTIAGILDEITTSFSVAYSKGGLLQTAFVISYMIFAPLFGYLGDRYNRRYIMAFGVFFWSLTTLVGSFMPEYHSFLLCRTLVGIGEASYSTIAPTIISDLFVSDSRSKMLALFYFAIPVGSGMGYIVGTAGAHLGGDWRWGLRITPVLGAVAVVLIIFFVADPVRGQIEGKSQTHASAYVDDVRHLVKNKSFMLSTLGFTCVSFVTGALAWWGPTYIATGQQIIRNASKKEEASISLVFGVIAMMSGVIGVPLGSVLATRLRPNYPKIDPTLCSIGLFVSTPFIFGALVCANVNTTCVFFLVFFGEVALNLNWAIVADMLLKRVRQCYDLSTLVFGIVTVFAGLLGVPLGALLCRKFRARYSVKVDAWVCGLGVLIAGVFTVPVLLMSPNGFFYFVCVFLCQLMLDSNWAIIGDMVLYVVVPARRSTAEAFQILFSHALGDAGSPYLIGLITDALNGTLSASVESGTVASLEASSSSSVNFKCLQYALFTTCFIEVIGAVFFLFTSFYIQDDKNRADAEINSEVTVSGQPTHMYADEAGIFEGD